LSFDLRSGGLLGLLFSDEGVPDGYLIILCCPLGTGIPRPFSVDLLATRTVAGSGIDVPFPLSFVGTGNCLQTKKSDKIF